MKKRNLPEVFILLLVLSGLLLIGDRSGLFSLKPSKGTSIPEYEKATPIASIKDGEAQGGSDYLNRKQELGQTTSVSTPNNKEASFVINDPAMAQKWDIQKTDAERAWQLSRGSRDIVVAVIDTGIDVNHEDLRANLWFNPGELGRDQKGRDKSKNGVDDDGNGFIDDVNGWNFVSNSSDLSDHHGHGTHIAGIIGAEAGNNKGIVGIAPKVSLMILKYFDPKTPSDNLKNTIRAIQYAVKMKAHIINYSGGGLEYSAEEKAAIDAARKSGILFVAAAGNEKSNSDQKPYYPADYGLSNIISVTAIDPNTEVLRSSNYGIETVDIAAPGQNILSTLPYNQYGKMTGTSQATAFVTGGAAIVMAHKMNFLAEDVKKYLLTTGDSLESLIGKTGTSRKLNLFKALTVLDQGLGATGVRAYNDSNLGNFAIDKNPAGGGGQVPLGVGQDVESESMGGFGKTLLNSIESSKLGQQ